MALALSGAALTFAAETADIVLINGIEEVGIGVTITDTVHPEALPLLKVVTLLMCQVYSLLHTLTK